MLDYQFMTLGARSSDRQRLQRILRRRCSTSWRRARLRSTMWSDFPRRCGCFARSASATCSCTPATTMRASRADALPAHTIDAFRASGQIVEGSGAAAGHGLRAATVERRAGTAHESIAPIDPRELTASASESRGRLENLFDRRSGYALDCRSWRPGRHELGARAAGSPDRRRARDAADRRALDHRLSAHAANRERRCAPAARACSTTRRPYRARTGNCRERTVSEPGDRASAQRNRCAHDPAERAVEGLLVDPRAAALAV